MMGIFSLIALTPLLSPIPLGYMAGMVLCTGLFSGVMGIKRANDEAKITAPQDATLRSVTNESTPVLVPMMGTAVAADRAEAPETTQWRDRTGGPTGNARIQQILANGSLSDRDRASAILAAREAAETAPAQRG